MAESGFGVALVLFVLLDETSTACEAAWPRAAVAAVRGVFAAVDALVDVSREGRLRAHQADASVATCCIARGARRDAVILVLRIAVSPAVVELSNGLGVRDGTDRRDGEESEEMNREVRIEFSFRGTRFNPVSPMLSLFIASATSILYIRKSALTSI